MQRLSSPPTVSLSRAPPAPTGRAAEFRNFSAPSSSLQAPDSTGLQVASGDVFRPYFYALSSISATWSSMNNKQSFLLPLIGTLAPRGDIVFGRTGSNLVQNGSLVPLVD
jgi:hypothetical protein